MALQFCKAIFLCFIIMIASVFAQTIICLRTNDVLVFRKPRLFGTFLLNLFEILGVVLYRFNWISVGKNTLGTDSKLV
jgi:hypothetical protein